MTRNTILAVTILGLVLLASRQGPVHAAQPELWLNHPGSRLEGFQEVRLADGKLTLTAERPGQAVIVLYSSQCLTVSEAENATVTLEPGWAGIFGYSHFGVRLDVPAAGAVTVAFTVAQPRKEPLVDTAEDFATFQREFAQRPSRFPDDADGFRAWQKVGQLGESAFRWL